MTFRDAKTKARGQIQLRFAKRAAKAVATFQCLVLSADPQRGKMLEQAATDGGWRASVCTDAATAMNHVNRSFVHLAIVDLATQDTEGFRAVLEKLTATAGVLSIVCGNDSDPTEELWARQLGAWLYLPGVEESSNLALLCGEARHIAQRVSKPIPEESPAAPVGQESFS